MTKVEIALEYMRRRPGTSAYAAAIFAGCNPGSVYLKLKGQTALGKKKRDAQQMVRLAVNAGIIKKEPCFICGATKVQGHHADYNEPLSVVWLCIPHHYETHGK